MFNNTGQGILVTDKSGIIKAINPAFTTVTGYREDEVLGKEAECARSDRQTVDFCIRESGMWQGEIWNRRKNGEEYLKFLNISAVKDETGEDIRYVGTFTDLTIHKLNGSK